MTLRATLQASLGAAYTIERELGGGGMSRVFVAEETHFRRRVVIKVLSPELTAGLSVERFEREIGLAAQLQHPNVVPVITAGDVDGSPGTRCPSSRAKACAHGIVHRDIKPENVLLSGGAAVVTDFGIPPRWRGSGQNPDAFAISSACASMRAVSAANSGWLRSGTSI